ncbi:hypothetical protein [Ligilactobacillus sp. Marseille-Q7487]|nr:hypothetical protein [Ligilactobacillus sp. Marseille-Q7487]
MIQSVAKSAVDEAKKQAEAMVTLQADRQKAFAKLDQQRQEETK